MPSRAASKAKSRSRSKSASASPTKNRTSSAISKRATATTTTTSSASAKAEQLAVEARVSSGATLLKQGTFKMTPENDTFDGTYEFGGWPGAIAVMVISHFLVFYAFTIIDGFGGQIIYPGHPALAGQNFFTAIKNHVVAKCIPTAQSFGTYLLFLFLEWALAVVMPGPVALGKPIASENGYRHAYRCNAIGAWYVLLSLVAVLDYTGTWKLSTIARNYGGYLSAAVIVGDIVSVVIYVWGVVAGRAVRMSGNLIYDFFMGSCLNPKLPLGVDFKMVAELRISWAYLFLITISHAKLMYEVHGHVTVGMWLLVCGHLLYANACQKGEECVPTSWDIFYEKFGWMLIFWNLAGVPVFYGVQALFIVKVRPTYELPLYIAVPVGVVLVGAYIIFDGAQAQKNRFRMSRDGVDEALIRRRTFPQVPWAILENPKTLKGPNNRELLIDGWFKYARKIHYTSDTCMAFCWGAACGFGYFAPFMYWTFHFFMLLHRINRDEWVMAKKYGKMWDEYVKIVPYRFIPGVY